MGRRVGRLRRFPYYRQHPEILDMPADEYAVWFRREVLFRSQPSPTRLAWREHRRAVAARTPQERAERRARPLLLCGIVAKGALKMAAFVAAALFFLPFYLASQQGKRRW